jgi:hypothetical protein
MGHAILAIRRWSLSMRPHPTLPIERAVLLALCAAAALALAACGSPAISSPPGGGTNPPPAATTSGGEPTDAPVAPVAGEPCSYLTAQELGQIIETTPVEVAERAGRGDCDYWLNAAKDQKVNIGVFDTPEALSDFDTTKTLGEPQPVAIGDDAYSIHNESIGTLVLVKEDQTVIVVQVLTTDDPVIQLIDATMIAQAVFDKL